MTINSKLPEILLSPIVLGLLMWQIIVLSPVTAAEMDLTDLSNYSIDLSITSTFQETNLEGVDGQWLFSVDLENEWQWDSIGLVSWVEYSKTVEPNTVADQLSFANGDAGTAVDAQNQGRFQLSSLYLYGQDQSSESLSWLVGLVEVSSLIDRSDYANDEVEQFLSLSMVNNLTIAFPDYTLAVLGQQFDEKGELGYRWLLSSSHGIQDGIEQEIQTYAQLLDVEQDNKGVFGAMEWILMEDNYQAYLGIWGNSGDEASADSGVYMSIDRPLEQGGFNLRLGYANAIVNEAQWFVAISHERALGAGTLASAMSITRYNSEEEQLLRHAEVYFRYPMVTDRMVVTAALQWFNGAIGQPEPSDGLIWTLRTSVMY